MSTYILKRDNQADLRIEGERLASIARSDRNRENYEIEFSLYRSDGGKLVGHFEYRTLVGGPDESHIAIVAKDVAELVTMVTELDADPMTFAMIRRDRIIQMFKDALEAADLEWIETVA